MTKHTSKPSGPPQAPDFKKVRNSLRTIQHREALGGFIKAGWTPSELSAFACRISGALRKPYAHPANYRAAMEMGADHPCAARALEDLRTPKGAGAPPTARRGS
ncbi:hypothetical protein BBta_6749 [Bradyrhizobium sp. BTAi1]|nr:hypothetical protein BBta_6749 [Bradyrhizobium sp. BTAi1]